jgi:ketosteroid isomerase-like protein
MSRFSVCLSVFLLLSFVAIAQSPAPAPASAQAQSAVTSAQSPEVTQFQKIEDSWADAVNRHDQYGLELVLSPLFVDVAASGDITTRNQQLVQVMTGEDKTLYLTQKVITVRMLGDIAVANGTYVLRRKAGSAQVDEKGVFTHVFERSHGGWLCLNSQRTKLPEETSGKSRKQSNTAEPFHIPLLTRGDKDK